MTYEKKSLLVNTYYSLTGDWWGSRDCWCAAHTRLWGGPFRVFTLKLGSRGHATQQDRSDNFQQESWQIFRRKRGKNRERTWNKRRNPTHWMGRQCRNPDITFLSPWEHRLFRSQTPCEESGEIALCRARGQWGKGKMPLRRDHGSTGQRAVYFPWSYKSAKHKKRSRKDTRSHRGGADEPSPWGQKSELVYRHLRWKTR